MIALRAESVGKAFRVYSRPLDSLKELFLRRPYGETFWAVRGVTFDVAAGDSLGIIGENGAGKSTLLRLLAGAMQATTGRVERNGRVAALLSLGAAPATIAGIPVQSLASIPSHLWPPATCPRCAAGAPLSVPPA